jgi:hypothetical protein
MLADGVCVHVVRTDLLDLLLHMQSLVVQLIDIYMYYTRVRSIAQKCQLIDTAAYCALLHQLLPRNAAGDANADAESRVNFKLNPASISMYYYTCTYT